MRFSLSCLSMDNPLLTTVLYLWERLSSFPFTLGMCPVYPAIGGASGEISLSEKKYKVVNLSQ